MDGVEGQGYNHGASWCYLPQWWLQWMEWKVKVINTELAGATYLSGGFNGGSVLQQQLHDLDAILLTGDVQRSETILETHNTLYQCDLGYNI